MNETSIWLRRQSVVGLDRHSSGVDCHSALNKLKSELDSELLEIIGFEQQIQSIGLKCRTIRENLCSKSNSIERMLNIKKEMTDRETQTEPIIKSEPIIGNNCNQLVSSSVKMVSNGSETPLRNSFRFKNSEINSKDLSELNPKLNRLSALVKGYLTRRLMKTNKVLNTVKEIRDTRQLLTDHSFNNSSDMLASNDMQFEMRLRTQLSKSWHQFYDIVFNYSKPSQMALISRLREQEIAFRFTSNSTQMIGLSSISKKVTEKRIQKNPITNSRFSPYIPGLRNQSTRTNPKVSVPIRRSQRNLVNKNKN